MSLLSKEDEENADVEVAWEDQLRICTFSKLNTRVQDLKDQLKAKKDEKEYYDDLSMELELADEDQPIMYKIGESFMYLPLKDAQEQLEVDVTGYDTEISRIESRIEADETEMKELRVVLYAKFGSSINLDPSTGESK